MPDISKDLQAIMSAVYGEEVRGSIHDAIRDINEVVESDTASAKTYKEAALVSATAAAQSEANAFISSNAASASEVKAKTSETNAKASENSAAQSALDAQGYAAAAAQETADEILSTVEDFMNAAESYAHGGTGTREDEDTDNAKYYRDQAEVIYKQLGSALQPQGSILFENLPDFADITPGFMYNMLDDFTTDERFREGPDREHAAGSNVYYIVEDGQDYWDIMGGGSVVGIATETTPGIVRPDNETITVDEEGVLHGAPVGIEIKEITEEVYMANKAELDAQDVEWSIFDSDSIVLDILSVTKERYLMNKDYYDKLPFAIDIIDDDMINAGMIPFAASKTESVADVVSDFHDEVFDGALIKTIECSVNNISFAANENKTVEFTANIVPDGYKFVSYLMPRTDKANVIYAMTESKGVTDNVLTPKIAYRNLTNEAVTTVCRIDALLVKYDSGTESEIDTQMRGLI